MIPIDVFNMAAMLFGVIVGVLCAATVARIPANDTAGLLDHKAVAFQITALPVGGRNGADDISGIGSIK